MRNRKKTGILGSIIKGLADLGEKDTKMHPTQSSSAKSSPKQGSPYYQQKPGVKKCQYWNCNKNIRANHFLCTEHYEDYQDYVIDKCPECGRYKDIEYDVCKDCYATPKKKSVTKDPYPKIRVEHSKAWEKGDQGVEKFFVYILKNDMGEFYAGHTRDLRVRLGEHRDGKTKSTSGKNLTLQYYEMVNSRKAAEQKEVELKRLIISNERKVRIMVQEFQDLHREVQINQ